MSHGRPASQGDRSRGSGFAHAVEGAPYEVNFSSVHVDFVVGGPEVEVDGLEAGGAAVPPLRGERWQMPPQVLPAPRGPAGAALPGRGRARLGRRPGGRPVPR